MDLSSECRHPECDQPRTRFSVFCERHHREQLQLVTSKMPHSKREPHPYEFSYRGMPVGYFLGDVYPKCNGVYAFELYSGPGHYELATAMRAGESCDCYHDLNGERVSYRAVERLPENRLRLQDFRVSPA